MTATAVVVDTVTKGVIELIKDTGVVGGRVWRMESLPTSTRLTYPYVALTELSDAAPVLSGDASDVQEWRVQYQVDIYHKKGPIDPLVRRSIVMALRNGRADVDGYGARYRIVGIVRPPVTDDVALRDSITLVAYFPLEIL